jgi:AcrR family transcriptional regulator
MDGLRQRKKQQTYEAIRAAAVRLFADRDFESVPVAEIARLAGVSVATVFNYFPTKEDLVYEGLETFQSVLLAAIRDREPGQSIPQAFRALLVQPQGLLASTAPGAVESLAVITKIITASPALRSRERRIYDHYTDALARLIADELSAEPGDIEPWVVANALMGVHRAVIEHVREGVLAGKSGSRLARGVRTQVSRAIATLERGLARYPVRPSANDFASG